MTVAVVQQKLWIDSPELIVNLFILAVLYLSGLLYLSSIRYTMVEFPHMLETQLTNTCYTSNINFNIYYHRAVELSLSARLS